MITDIFSTPVYKNKFYISNEEYNFILNSERESNLTTQISIDKFILNNVELKELKSQCDKYLEIYATEVLSLDPDRCCLRLTQSWVNYNKKGLAHHNHCHSNSIVSAVLYLTESPSDLVIVKPNIRETLIPTFKNFNKYNSAAFHVKNSKNDIILFPSYLYHHTKVNEQEEDRISLSFNSFYYGDIGLVSDTTGLRLE
jgi:uncharacterized protein (TIGR02466 family)